ncbi:hypothetical protein [Rhizomicrobium electricum]|uniref:Type II secretion system protein GspC N-terminal domain-containing protein n=1 Tax=Rhizomicrobium electricum TaxID=480070 RepID=A0ABN1ENU8_9PROT|nr:hypothetical protein [Rhizomicrobium electricum]NIJ48771.1 hypothetical protein [Rhizomicrobium electricum]
MADFREILSGAAGPTGLAMVGTLMLVAVVVPSPTRLTLWRDRPIPIVNTPFPESPRNVSEADLAAVIERPLFNSDRKKDPPPEAQTALPGLDSYRLAGIIITRATTIAIIERSQSKTSSTVKVGDLLDGRAVGAITSEGVSLTYGGRSDVLAVPKISGASLAAPAPNADAQKQSTNIGGKRESK